MTNCMRCIAHRLRVEREMKKKKPVKKGIPCPDLVKKINENLRKKTVSKFKDEE